MPPLPVDNEKERIIDSTGALKLSKVPNRLIVVGGGVIGLELGSVWRRLGAKVEVVEFLDHIAGPNDADVSSTLQRCLTKQGMKFRLNTKVTGSEVTENGVKVQVENKGAVWREKMRRRGQAGDAGGGYGAGVRGTRAQHAGIGSGEGGNRDGQARLCGGGRPSAHQVPAHLRHRRSGPRPHAGAQGGG